MASTGFNSGKSPKRPAAGKNGPNDKGGGTRTFKPPMPKGGQGINPGTKK